MGASNPSMDIQLDSTHWTLDVTSRHIAGRLEAHREAVVAGKLAEEEQAREQRVRRAAVRVAAAAGSPLHGEGHKAADEAPNGAADTLQANGGIRDRKGVAKGTFADALQQARLWEETQTWLRAKSGMDASKGGNAFAGVDKGAGLLARLSEAMAAVTDRNAEPAGGSWGPFTYNLAGGAGSI